MAVYSVDSDAVFAATAGVRATADRVRAETHTMLAQLTGLQSHWTGAASLAFAGVIDQWRASHLIDHMRARAARRAAMRRGRELA